jgi:4-hydroxybenzoyl-CoA reductase subunit beta
VLLPDHQYLKAESLSECLQQLRDNSERAQVVAGGTDVIFNMRLKLFEPDIALSIRRVPELQQVEELDAGGLRIGAGCRLTDLAENDLINDRYPAFAESIKAVASAHIRNIATLGGNINLKTRCWYTNNSEQWRQGVKQCFKTDGELCHVIKSSSLCHAINNADTPLPLIALDAVLTLQSTDSQREVPIAEFYRKDGMNNTVLAPDELVTHVTLPPVSDRTVFLKIAARQGMDFSLAAIAGRAAGTGTDAEDVRLVVGSISMAPIVLDRPARIAEEQGLTDAAIEQAMEQVRPELGELTSLYARAAYKAHLAKVLVRRALVALRET